MFRFYYVVSLAPVPKTIVLSTRWNTNNDFDQSIKSTRHDLDIARINAFLVKQELHERITPLRNLLTKMILRWERTRDLDRETQRMLSVNVQAQKQSLAAMEARYKLRVDGAQSCVDRLLRQLEELERGEEPTVSP